MRLLPGPDAPATLAGVGTGGRRASLAWQLALRVGLAGVASFVLIAVIVGLLEQRRLEAQAREQARQNIEAVREALAATVWQMDRSAQTLLLSSLVRDGSIVGVWVVEAGEVRNDAWRTLRSNTPSFGGIAPWKLPLYGPDSGAAIAELWVQESVREVGSAPLGRLATVAVAEALKVALVVAVVLWLVNSTLTQPLRRLAAGVRGLDLAEPAARLDLGRSAKPPGRGPDELDELTDSIARLHAGQAQELRRRVLAEQRAAEQAAEQALILATLSEGVMAFDRRGQPLYANRAAVELLQLGEDLREGMLRAIGERRSFWRERFQTLQREANAAQRPAQGHITELLRRVDGAELPVEASLTALPKGPLGYVVVLRDVSAERAAEQARDESRAARAADRAKSEFLSRMSHELRTPLNAVLGFADVLLAGTPPLAAQQRQLVGHMRGAGVHLLRLISDLLDLSRIEAGTLSLDLQTVAAAPLVTEAAELISPAAQARGIEVALRLEGPQPALLSVDETRLRQVLMNLLSNAVKYNRERGRIEVTLRCGDERVEIEVTDSGLGMTPEQLERMFTPFSRLGRERSKIEGTGIGLVIARHLVQMMGGELSCSSTPGQGSRFAVCLPRVLAGAGQPAEGGAGSPHAAPSARGDVTGSLVLVEDSEINRLMIELYLHQRPGVAGHYAEDVDGGIALIRAQRPRLALIDMHLGHRSGAEVLAAVKADAQCAGVVCVAFTADALPEQQAALLAQGFDATWIKPLGLAEFLERLDAVMLKPLDATC